MENQKEIWKDIEGYTGLYQVSSFGRVKSLKYGKEKVLGDSSNSRGYISVALFSEGKRKSKTIHRLVAETFLGKSDLDVNHKDGNTINNNLENLEYVTTRDNSIHGYKSKKTSSQYPGVYFDKTNSKWKAYTTINGKVKSLGRFKTELEAYNTYLKALGDNGIESKYASSKA